MSYFDLTVLLYNLREANVSLIKRCLLQLPVPCREAPDQSDHIETSRSVRYIKTHLIGVSYMYLIMESFFH